MATGIVNWYDPDKGYGFIVPDDGGDEIFVQRSGLGGTVLDAGDRVAFAVQDGPRGPIAEDVRVTERAVSTPSATDRLIVPVHEEQLSATTRQVQIGDVLIHKRVETVPVETAIDLMHDEVSVARVPVNRPVDTMPEARYEGDTLVVPVVEEVLVTEKRLVLREELRITRRRVTETAPIHETVRREVVEVEGRGAEGVTAKAQRIRNRKRRGRVDGEEKGAQGS